MIREKVKRGKGTGWDTNFPQPNHSRLTMIPGIGDEFAALCIPDNEQTAGFTPSEGSVSAFFERRLRVMVYLIQSELPVTIANLRPLSPDPVAYQLPRRRLREFIAQLVRGYSGYVVVIEG